MKFFYFLLLLVLGFLMVRYSKWLQDHTFRIEIAEKFFGHGGTNIAWKIIGVVVLCFAFYYLMRM
jgi:predicted ABC-type exoprotein transport system permease subunit